MFSIYKFSFPWIVSESNHSVVFLVTYKGIVLLSSLNFLSPLPCLLVLFTRHLPCGSAKWEICHRWKLWQTSSFIKVFIPLPLHSWEIVKNSFLASILGVFFSETLRAKCTTVPPLTGTWSLPVTSGTDVKWKETGIKRNLQAQQMFRFFQMLTSRPREPCCALAGGNTSWWPSLLITWQNTG